jgi:hypothetical protein
MSRLHYDPINEMFCVLRLIMTETSAGISEHTCIRLEVSLFAGGESQRLSFPLREKQTAKPPYWKVYLGRGHEKEELHKNIESQQGLNLEKKTGAQWRISIHFHLAL